MLIRKYLKRRRHLCINSQNIFPSFAQIRGVNYLLIIISCVYIMQRTGGFHVTSLHYDFSHLYWLHGLLIWMSTWPTEFPETASASSKRIHRDGQRPICWGGLWARDLEQKEEGFCFPALMLSMLSRAEFKSLTTPLEKGSLPRAFLSMGIERAREFNLPSRV